MYDDMRESQGQETRRVTRHGAGSPALATDTVAIEAPVALVFNGVSHAVMMATPADLAAFGAGFALTEGIVGGADEIYDIEVRHHAHGIEVQMTVAQQAFHALKVRRRSLAGRSGCGVCGIESLALLDLQPEKVPAAACVDAAAVVARAGQELPEWQPLMRRTGAVHAAAWCAADGRIIAVFEDVGRHNAMDKLIGHLALQNKANPVFSDGFVFMSSRASYELVRKAARMGIPMLAAISAPSTLAIDLAHQAGMRLMGFCRQNGCVEY